MIHDSTLFSESQGLKPQILLPIVALLIAVSAYLFMEQLIAGNPVGDAPVSNEVLVLVVLFTGILMPAFLFSLKLRTVVDQGAVRVSLFPMKRLVIPLKDVQAFGVKRYDWLRDYGGFGLRFNSEGWAYIMQGDTGVQIQRRDGTRVLIGSADAEGFIQALRIASGMTESSEQRRR